MAIQVIALMLCSMSNPDYNGVKSQERGVAICNRNVSTAKKNYIYRRDGINDHAGYCINHIVPLAIGGSNNEENLEAMEVDQNGQCHAEGEVRAINCFMNKQCTQEEAFAIIGLE